MDAFEDDVEASDIDDDEPSEDEDAIEDVVKDSSIRRSRVPPKKWNRSRNSNSIDRTLLDGSIHKLENSFRSRNYHFNDFQTYRVLEPLKRVPMLPMDDHDEVSVNFTFSANDKPQQLRRFQAISHEAGKGNAYSMF